MRKKRSFFVYFLIILFLCSIISCSKSDSIDFENGVEENNFPILGDRYETDEEELFIDLLGHASIKILFNDKFIYVDPYGQIADYSILPKADLILITHEHRDHFDIDAINKIQKLNTKFITSQIVGDNLEVDAEVLNNGENTVWESIKIEAAPAYNLIHKNDIGEFFHPKGRGNGYVLSFNNFRLYIAGDTENIPEMADLKNIKVAFLPKNIPYTMTDEMFVDAAKKVNPQFLYVYHNDPQDTNKQKLQKEIGETIILK
ncbi:MAG: MBL fold metallo-hydrolase [Elusimicrobiota bacterium]|jgi:L-ascorbate metabolism protein UlaG (beta-lactamase superfamily)|nr:MBL fold metallo-hydrolase [Elusimicrobiota bacterium]